MHPSSIAASRCATSGPARREGGWAGVLAWCRVAAGARAGSMPTKRTVAGFVTHAAIDRIGKPGQPAKCRRASWARGSAASAQGAHGWPATTPARACAGGDRPQLRHFYRLRRQGCGQLLWPPAGSRECRQPYRSRRRPCRMRAARGVLRLRRAGDFRLPVRRGPLQGTGSGHRPAGRSGATGAGNTVMQAR